MFRRALSVGYSYEDTSTTSTSDESSGFSSFIAWGAVGPNKPPQSPRYSKVDERGGKPPVYRARSGTVGGASSPAGGTVGVPRKQGGYHSEGYFSSDQDEDGPRKAELRSPRSPRTSDTKSPLLAGGVNNGVARSASQDFHRTSPMLRTRPGSPDAVGRRATASITLNESASFLIEKMINSTPETKRKSSVGSRPGDTSRSCCKGLEKKPSVADITGRSSRSSSDRGSRTSAKLEPRKLDSGSTHTNCQPFRLDRNTEAKTREEDEVSEAGTYTIDKDSSPELDRARGDIERVFGLPGDAAPYSPADPQPPSWEAPAVVDTYTSSPSLSRNSPNWIQQWAAQVAEQTSAGEISDVSKAEDTPVPSSKSSIVSPRGSKLSMLPSLLGSQEGSDLIKPRRKLPTPPNLQQPFPSRATDMAELEALAKMRPSHEEASRTQCPQASDTQCYLRETEDLLTSLQARVTDNTPITSSGGYRISSFESHDSGGDSDVDTSKSYAVHDDRTPLSLRAKLKLSGLDSSHAGLGPSVLSPRASKADSSSTSHMQRERSILSDGGYAAAAQADERSLQSQADERSLQSQADERSLQSDSSSETSDLFKDGRRNKTNNNPPLKYNRAFSLRRARLEDSPAPPALTRQPPLTPTEIRKQQHSVIRTASTGGGTPIGARRAPAGVRGSSATPSDSRSSPALPHQAIVKSPSRSSLHKKDPSAQQRKQPGSRSNSTMSSKEVDFQNWKRRKNYDPMKAAKDARKKQQEKREPDKGSGGNVTSSDRGSPSPPSSLLRSASFHGTEVILGGRWTRLQGGRYPPHNPYGSEDDGPVSYEVELPPPTAPHASPLRRSPTSPYHLSGASPSHGPAGRGRRSSYAHSDDSEPQASPTRRVSVGDTGSEGKRSPLSLAGGGTCSSPSAAGVPRLPTAAPNGRSRVKIEALDNLVISTVHSLSVKVRGTSESLLQKLKTQYGSEDRDRAELLQSVLNHLNSESDSATSQIRSTSRDLSGILKNLKKIQTALEVIDQVMAVAGGDFDDLEDLAWPNTNPGSDY